MFDHGIQDIGLLSRIFRALPLSQYSLTHECLHNAQDLHSVGTRSDPLETQFPGELGHGGAIEKIVLPVETFDDAESFLDLTGLNAFNFFPDREGLRMKHEAQTRKTINDVKAFYSRRTNK
jgi:hypothetical protein